MASTVVTCLHRTVGRSWAAALRAGWQPLSTKSAKAVAATAASTTAATATPRTSSARAPRPGKKGMLPPSGHGHAATSSASAAALFSPAVAAALAAYKAQHRDLLVPARFQVPAAAADQAPTTTPTRPSTSTSTSTTAMTTAWPAATRGIKLGRVVSALRTAHRKRQLPAATVAQLDALGFVWNVRKYQGDRIVLALQTYKEVHGDIHVPKRFQCPSDDPRWPPEVRTLKLGYNLSNVRNRGDWEELSGRLEAMGVDLDHKYKDTRGWDLMLAAAVRFKLLAGHARVPKDFEVPTAPPEDTLKHASAPPEGTVTWSSAQVAAAPAPDAAVLAALNGMTARARLEHMQSRPELWPPECWGMKLGQKLSNIIYHASFAERRAQFEAAGIPVSKRLLSDNDPPVLSYT